MSSEGAADPLPGAEVAVDPASIDPPEWLEDEAREEFLALVTDRGHLAEVEIANLATYCFLYQWWRRARHAVEQIHEGEVRTWVATDDQERPHPAYLLEARLAEELGELAAAVGCEAPDRRRLTPTRIWFLHEHD